MEFTSQQREVRQWLERRRAVMLAHNYQPGPIQDVADLVGDSLELSMAASKTDAEVIVFCGVHFMAETAAILCPDKTVLLPRTDVGCLSGRDPSRWTNFRARKAEFPGCRWCSLHRYHRGGEGGERHLLHLRQCRAGGEFSDSQARADGAGPEPGPLRGPAHPKSVEIITWEGWCNVHDGLTAEEVLKCREIHPQADLLAHPECNPKVLDQADAICSTSGMLQYVHEVAAQEFMIGTEQGILHRLRKESGADPAHAFDSLSHQDHQREHVRGGRVSQVHEEIGVDGGYFGAAPAHSFEAGGLHQPARVPARAGS